MHDFSYTGGFLGIVTGSIYLIARKMMMKPVPPLT